MCVGCVGRGHSLINYIAEFYRQCVGGLFFFGKKNKKYNGSIPVSEFKVLGSAVPVVLFFLSDQLLCTVYCLPLFLFCPSFLTKNFEVAKPYTSVFKCSIYS